MAMVNHVNYVDDFGRVYCRRRDAVVVLDDQQTANYCSTCPFYNGSAQGLGVECLWNDPRKDIPGSLPVMTPEQEYAQIHVAESEANRTKKALVVSKDAKLKK